MRHFNTSCQGPKNNYCGDFFFFFFNCLLSQSRNCDWKHLKGSDWFVFIKEEA